MVDAIVSFAVQRLGDFLIREAGVLFGVKEEVVWLQRELTFIRSFLKDAEQKQDGDERIRVWVSEIQDIAYDTEDIIEAFSFKVKGPVRTSKLGMVSSSVRNCFGISTNSDDLYGIGKDIEDIKSRVLEVTRQRESYGINNIGGGGVQDGTSSGASKLRDLRLTTSYADEEDVVGYEDDTELLETKLFQGEPRRSVISILGMGGLGKTTLARKLYKNNKTKFNCHAWVCVSQEWKTRDLLERLIKSFKRLTKDEYDLLKKMKDYDMEQYLRELLEGCRYLVVIDDVWHKEAWESLRNALPDNMNGGRIIITTRNEVVAEVSDQRTYVHKLRFLRPDESWQLFCTKAFPETNGVCPPDMKTLGEKMMAKCSGLPLTIIVLGGLLSRKQFHEWQGVKDRIWLELKDDSIYISSLLELSYKDLPHVMKSCFLYLGLFPEDFEINTEKLIRMWVAEEFIPHGEGLDLEELAENYMKELIGRSLIQVVARNWRMISTCRVHDLLRDLAISKAKKLNFLYISDESRNSALSTEALSYRRIVFHSRFKSCMPLDHSHQRVRTLSIINSHNFSVGDAERLTLMELLDSRFGPVRVLDLDGFALYGEVKKRFDEVIGKLIHLRYLGLNRTYIRELPESIGNLQALQTLNVSNNDQRIMLPRGISKLKQLRHLIGLLETKKGSLYATPLVFEELTNLRTLTNVDIDSYPGNNTGNHLALNAFANLENLKCLSVRFYSSCRLSVQPLFNCRHLIELKIYGGINNLSKEMHKSLSKLKYLALSRSELDQDPMPALEMLPNLMFLRLDDVRANLMSCTATGFPQLQVLELSGFQNSTNFQLEEGGMPRLRVLSLANSEKLILPERLKSLLSPIQGTLGM